MSELKYDLLKWNVEGREQLFKCFENGCGVITENGKHYLTSKILGLKEYEISEKVFQELLKRKVITI